MTSPIDNFPETRHSNDAAVLSAADVKQSAVAGKVEATRAIAELKRQQDKARADLEAQRHAMELEFQKRRAELDAQLAPLQAELAKLTEVAWTVDLYLGRDEDLTLLRDGEPAPADTPITIRQRVLVMAEESLLLLDRGGNGMDYKDINLFANWMLADPENLNRVLPDPKGVVVMIPTNVSSDSGNAWEDAARNQYNQQSYWFLRNGEKLYLLTVDDKLKIGDRLLPKRDEFTSIFEQRLFGFGGLGRPVEPGSDEWLALEAKADARRRHYMRVMMVLAGLVARTPVWAPLPEGGVNLLDVAAQYEGKVRLVQDGDNSIQLTDGRESFDAWQRRLNQQLRPGLRVIGNWHLGDFRGLGENYRNPRLYPSNIDSVPASDVPHLIEDRRDGGFVIRFERTDMVYRRGLPVPDRPGYIYIGEMPTTPKQRASCLIMPNDTWVLPYDLVTVAELDYYLNSRDNRERSFLNMVPTLRAALSAKLTEALAEQPFREHLGRMLVGEGASENEVMTLVDELVHWWKLARTWTKPLNGDRAHEGKATREILAEFRSRRQSASIEDEMVRIGRTVPGAICVAANRQGQWHAYAPSAGARDAGVFLDITRIYRDGRLGETRQWQSVPQRSASLLKVAWSDEAWAGWKFAANPAHYLIEPQRDALASQMLDLADGTPVAVTELFDSAKPNQRQLQVWYWVGDPPETSELRVTGDALGSREEYGANRRMVMVERTVARRDGEIVLLTPTRERYRTAFSGYALIYRGLSGVPWWNETDGRTWDTRPRLIWVDDEMIDRIASWVNRCKEAYRAKDAAEQAVNKLVESYVQPTLAAAAVRREQLLHEQFVLDYGTDAEDLWPAHLKSVRKNDTPGPNEVRALIRRAVEDGKTVEGMTLGELVDAYGMSRIRVVDTYRDVRVPVVEQVVKSA